MTPLEKLSPESLASISPDLTLSTLAQLIGTSDSWLNRIVNRRRAVSEKMAVRIERGIEEARRRAAAGTLPKRHNQGRPRR